MKIRMGAVALAMLLAAVAAAQDSTSLNRSEVAALKAKIVAVQQAMGGEPSGYVRGEEDSFSLPTDFNPAEGGKFWPITAGVQMRFTDRGVAEGTASAEQAAEDFQRRYLAALSSGDAEAIEKMLQEMNQIQTAAAAAAMSSERKDDMTVYVQLNMNPIVGIDPDAVVLEQPGVIALREKDDPAGAKGRVTVYLDPVALAKTEELSKIELRTADDGVTKRTGVFHIVIEASGALPDIESWVADFDYPAMLAQFDAR